LFHARYPLSQNYKFFSGLFGAGQFFEVKIEYAELTQKEFDEKMARFKSRLEGMFAEGLRLEDEIKKQLGHVKYEKG
jgi:type I restriction enzyme M protein